MFCRKCGNKIKDNARFCSSCGNKIEEKNVPDFFPYKDSGQIKKHEVNTEVSDIHEKEEYISELICILNKVIDKKTALISLNEFSNYLKKEEELPQSLPNDPENLIEIKDLLKAAIIGIIITAIIAPLSGIKITFWNFMECVLFFSFIAGGISYLKNKIKYAKNQEIIGQKRLEMLEGTSISKFKFEDDILSLINKNYNKYIGDLVFTSTSIRYLYKDLFQSEINNILAYVEEAQITDTDLPSIIEKYYKHAYETGIDAFQVELDMLKKEVVKFKEKFEDFGEQSYVIDAQKILDGLSALDKENFSSSLSVYTSAVSKIKEEFEKIDKCIQSAEEQREEEIKLFESKILIYKKELAEIYLKRKKYPDTELSNSFIRAYKAKRCEIEEKLHLPIETIKNKVFEIEDEIRKGIDSLNEMIETEYVARHKRIYGKPQNKLASKFKSIYR